MKTLIYLCLPILLLTACSDGNSAKEETISPQKGAELARQKCSRCHNLDMPPVTSDKEAAPPLFTVTVHLKDWIKADTDGERRAKFIDFVKDYVIHPSRKKSYCDPASLKTYGLMPSQKGKVTTAELGAIAAWAYDHYDQMEMLKIMKERNRLAALPPYRQVLETRDCKSCHILGAGKLAPSFAEIAERYRGQADGLERIEGAIAKGSRGRWPEYKVPMRAYEGLSPAQLRGIAQWILRGGKQE
ncbi:c-type cytochrome [Nitratifractor sp.]